MGLGSEDRPLRRPVSCKDSTGQGLDQGTDARRGYLGSSFKDHIKFWFVYAIFQ